MPGRITHAQEDWDDRGHIPAHDVKDIQRYLAPPDLRLFLL